jgi:hypothetical protein
MMEEKEAFIERLNQLMDYIEDGIRDYIGDNSLLDYLDPNIGHGQEDLDALKGAWQVKKWVQKDDYPWWEQNDTR